MRRLKQLVADLSSDKHMLQDVVAEKIVKSAKKRLLAGRMQAYLGISERGVCAVLPLPRNTLRDRPQRQGYGARILRIRDSATARPRFDDQRVRVLPTMALRPNERWGMNFVMDELTCGRRFRVLTMVPNWNRFSPMLRVDFCSRGTCVAAPLQEARGQHGLPKIITVDKGSEFILRALGTCACGHAIRLNFIRPTNRWKMR